MLRTMGRAAGVLAVAGVLTVLTAGQRAPAGEACCGEAAGAAKAKPAGVAVCDDDSDCAGGPACCSGSCEVTKFLRPYFTIRAALANDSLDGVARAAGKLAKCAGCRLGKQADGPLAGALGKLSEAATPLFQAASKGDLAAVRKAFHKLSEAAIALVEAAEKSKQPVGAVTIYGCGMSKPFGKWLQRAGTAMGNPYQGKKMLTCGKPVRTIGAKAAAPTKPATGGKDDACEDGCCGGAQN